ncbi:hypothetical protein [Fredinandcohnia sp. 179-A 10B2 NHS]|uniref:hypothetical protein n=1 Tax=Fredinandcohnia sp. 179-A 10B2 NHS TaxID=3235176 RepID=UPI0039A2CEA6
MKNEFTLPDKTEMSEVKEVKKPFKKIRNRMIVIISVLTIVFASMFVFMIQKGEFTKWNHSTYDINLMKDKEVIYLGNYILSWNGYGNPKILDIYFIQMDGTIVREEQGQLTVTPYIDHSQTIGVVDETHVREEGLEDELVPIQGYQSVNKEYHLAFRVELKDKADIQDVHTMVVEFRHFGLKKTQEIEFEGFFHESDENE